MLFYVHAFERSQHWVIEKRLDQAVHFSVPESDARGPFSAFEGSGDAQVKTCGFQPAADGRRLLNASSR